MRILVTSSRNPFALDAIRKLGQQGHTVVAADTFGAAAGNHSKYAVSHETTASPTHATDRFIADIVGIIERHDIELVLPTFEEAFYLAARRRDVPSSTAVYTGTFGQLAQLHDKVSFQHLAELNDVRIPATIVAHDDGELRDATAQFEQYFARAAFSRGGVALLTNTGPLAGAVDITDCHPTPEQPWLVQQFVAGPMVCSYSTVHDGHITAHCTYRAPRQWAHSTGISFLAVDSTATLEIAGRFAESMRYTGQLSFDFVESDGELYIIECNPRSTDAILLFGAEQFARGVTEPDGSLAVVDPGQQVQLDTAVIAEAFTEPIRNLPAALREVFHVADANRGWHDHMPSLWSAATLFHGVRSDHRAGAAILEALAGDIVWNGAPIDGMGADNAATLAAVHRQVI